MKFYSISLILFCPCFIVSVCLAASKAADLSPLPPAPQIDDPQNLNTPEYVIIRSSDQATFSSETTASVATLSVKEGSKFQAGDILLQLDCRLQQAELNKAEAQQRATSAAQKSAMKLKSYGSISDFELTKATSEAQITDAEVNKLKAIVEKCTIKAPFNGAVAELMVHPYETVKVGDPLLKIVSTEHLEFEMQVPSCWLQWLHIGSVFNVHINEINKNISAQISKINPQIEPVSESIRIIATILPGDVTLLPGMSGQAVFPGNPTKCPQSKT